LTKGATPRLLGQNGNASGRIQKSHRFSQAVARDNCVRNRDAETIAHLADDPLLDVEDGVLQKIVVNTNDVSQRLRFHFEFGQTGLQVRLLIVGETGGFSEVELLACPAHVRRDALMITCASLRT
jgi:hypothetical protein